MGLFFLGLVGAKAAREARKSRLELERQTKELKAQTQAMKEQEHATDRDRRALRAELKATRNAEMDRAVKESAPEVGQFRIRVVSVQDDTSGLARLYSGLTGEGVFAAMKFAKSLPLEVPKAYTQADAEKARTALMAVGATAEILAPSGDVIIGASEPATSTGTNAPQHSSCARCRKKFTLGFGKTVCENPICGQTWCLDCSPGLFVHKCPACGGACR